MRASRAALCLQVTTCQGEDALSFGVPDQKYGEDIEAAVVRVREAGGTVLAEPARQPYGVSAECTDDQGARFYLGEF